MPRAKKKAPAPNPRKTRKRKSAPDAPQVDNSRGRASASRIRYGSPVTR